MASDLLAVAERTLKAAQAILQAGIESSDTVLTVAGIREVRGALELVAKLQPPADVGSTDDAGFDAAVSELLQQITQQASPACARCGSSCSECASELVPPMSSIEDLYRAKALLARDRGPGGSGTPVVDADVVEDVRVVAAPEKPVRRALPPACADGCACWRCKDKPKVSPGVPGPSGGPVSIVRGDGGGWR